MRRIVVVGTLVGMLVTAGGAEAGNGGWTSTHPDGGSFGPGGVAVHPAVAGAVYSAPLFRGIYRSTDGGATWTSITDDVASLPFDRTGVVFLDVDVAARLWAIASASGRNSLLRSADAGVSWSVVDQALAPDAAVSLALAPADPDHVWEGTDGPSGTVHTSTDGGATWSAGTGIGDSVLAIAVDPNDVSRVWAGTQTAGVFRSTDGGATFAAANGGAPLEGVLDLAVDPVDGDVVYAANNDSGGGGRRLWKTTDGGATWSDLGDSFWDFQPGRQIALDPTDHLRLLVVSDTELRESTDGGATWATALATDGTVSAVVFDPSAPATVLAGSRNEGLFRSTDGGATWASSHAGIRGARPPHSKSRSVHFDTANASRVFAGTIHRGHRSTDGGVTWAGLGHPTNEIGAFVTHPAAPDVVYASTNEPWRSTDAGVTWAQWDNGAFCCFQETDLAGHPGDAATLYLAGHSSCCAADGVWKTTDGGLGWTHASSGIATPQVRTLGVDPTDGDVVYAAGADWLGSSGVWKSTDGAASWTPLGGGLPTPLSVDQILVHPADPSLVWIAAEVENGGIWRSTDAGGTWQRMLAENANSVAVDPGNADVVYAGTWNTTGFWRSLDRGVTWALVVDGLPYLPGIESLAVDPTNAARVLAGTTGGVYEITFAGSVEILVTTPADDGPGSLRQALLQAAADGLPNRIRFHPGLAGATIVPETPLPALGGEPTDLDGDLDGDCVPDVGIAGWSLAGIGGNGLDVATDGHRVAGLAIHSFDCPGCGGDGIVVAGNANLVECNHLGTDQGGGADLGIATYGIKVVFGATGNTVARNQVLWNGAGIGVTDGASGNTIGPDNNVAWNDGAGVQVLDGDDGLGGRVPTEGNTITANLLHANGGLGIDLGGDGVTANDPGDADVGPNTLLDFPVLTGSTDLGGDTFTVAGTAAPDATVEVFARQHPDPSGHGEGIRFLAATVASPAGAFSVDVTLLPGNGEYSVAATATDAAGNTSEFSAGFPLVVHALTVTSAADAGPGSLRDALEQGNGDGTWTEIGFAPGMAGQTIHLLSELPPIAEDGTTVDADQGGDCVPDVAISGALVPPDQQLWSVRASDNVVRGLALVDSPHHGLIVTGGPIPRRADRNVVECAWVGVDLAGAPAGNGGHGIHVLDGASDNRFGPGLVVAHNGGAGIEVRDGLDHAAFPAFAGRVPDFAGVFPVIDLDDGCGAIASADAIVPTDGGGGTFHDEVGMRLTGTLFLGDAGGYTFTFENLDDQARLVVDGVERLVASGPGSPSVNVGLSAGGHAIEVDFLEGGGATHWKLAVAGPGSASFSSDGNAGGCAAGQPGLCGELFRLRVPSEGNTVTETSTRDNGGPGISLSCCCSPLANDPGDVDVGPNTLLDHPVITAATPVGGGDFTVDGTAPPDATVEVYGAAPDPSGHGEGDVYLGATTSTPAGTFSTVLTIPGQVLELTATATDAAGNTSELGPVFPAKDPDEIALADVVGYQGDTVEIPIRVRDLASTPLGSDQGPGNRIQGFAVQVGYAPAASIDAVDGARAGVTAGLTPLFETNVGSGGTRTWLVSFDEGTDPVPLTLDAAAPGDQVGKLVVVVDPLAPPGPVSFQLLAGTSLSNESGSIVEDAGAGTLHLVHATLTVRTRAATALVAFGVSASQVGLSWIDPQADETGFRVERSPDGAAWSTVATLGPGATSHTDGGLAAATLHYYRVVSFGPGGDNPPSNVASASTFPAVPAKVCAVQVTDDHSAARFPSVARGATRWAVTWEERSGGALEQIDLRLLDDATGSPVGATVRVTDSDNSSQIPYLAWNGSRHGVFRNEHMRGPDGLVTSRLFLSAYDQNLTPIVRDRRLDPAGFFLVNLDRELAIEWDGAAWAAVVGHDFGSGVLDLALYRLGVDGGVLAGPIALTAHPEEEYDADLTWNGALHGLAWIRPTGPTAFEVWFRRLQADGTPPPGDPGPALLWSSAASSIVNITSVAWDGAGWAVAWADLPTDPADGFGIVRMRRIDAAGAPVGAVARLSDAQPPGDVVEDDDPELFPRPGGAGWIAFTASWDQATGAYEISRLLADPAGTPTAPRATVTNVDGANSYWTRVATDGGRFLVANNDAAPGTQEIAVTLTDGAGAPIGGPYPLTGGHSPGDAFFQTTGGSAVVEALAGGFAVVWADRPGGGPPRLQLQVYEADGSPGARRQVSGFDVVSLPAAEGVGDTLAVVWRSSGGDLVFRRLLADGSDLTGDVVLRSGLGGPPGVGLAWSGERYGVAWRQGPTLRFQQLDPGGAQVGPETMVAASGVAGPLFWVEWVGTGFGVVWRAGDGFLRYAVVDPLGAVVVGPVPVGGNGVAEPNYGAVWTGAEWGVSWREAAPGANAALGYKRFHVATFDRDGTPILPDVLVHGEDTTLGAAILVAHGGGLRLLHTSGDPDPLSDGIAEDAISLGGVVTQDAALHALRGNFGGDVASDGATLGVVWTQLGELYFQTSACLADATPPPCPAVTVAESAAGVEVDWTPVGDAESGIWRYDLYRDGAMLTEAFASTTSHTDRGVLPGTVHEYELRAMNGAYAESVGCPTHTWSTVPGDTNGDGMVDALDVVYLVLHLFAGGPPPQGDADVDDDGDVDVGDVFYLIDAIFGGGPPPTVVDGSPAGPRDELRLGDATGAPGTTVAVPIRVRDVPGTALDEGKGHDGEIQGLAFRLDLPAGAVTAASFAPAGVTAGRSALLPIVVRGDDHVVVVVTYDQTTDPLPFTLGAPAPGDLAGHLHLTLRHTLPDGPIPLVIHPATAALVNHAGTTGESVGRGDLTLTGATLTVHQSNPTLFTDGFETGTTAAWSGSVP